MKFSVHPKSAKPNPIRVIISKANETKMPAVTSGVKNIEPKEIKNKRQNSGNLGAGLNSSILSKG